MKRVRPSKCQTYFCKNGIGDRTAFVVKRQASTAILALQTLPLTQKIQNLCIVHLNW